MDITIREYQSSDWEEVKLLIIEAENFGPSMVKSEKQRIEFYLQVPVKGITFVVENKEKVSGGEEGMEEVLQTSILGYSIVDYFGKSAFILSLVVKKEWRGKGIGRELINFIKNYVRDQQQFDILRGFADDRYFGVHSFLLKQGFKTCGYIIHDLELNQGTIHYVIHLRTEKDEKEKDTFISG
ncbi:GNAT family N-acetyltransferase [Candidatus Hodarchaeum mangrovi]